MKKNLHLFLFLAVVAAISGLLIGYVNSIVDPLIKANDVKAENQNLAKIFPDSTFTELTYDKSDGTVLKVYRAEGAGYVVKATAVGYNASDPLIVLIGFDNEGQTVAVIPLQMQETNGYGSRCFEENNIADLYLGRALNEDVGLLSGATLTSQAMKTAIQAAQAAIKEAS